MPIEEENTIDNFMTIQNKKVLGEKIEQPQDNNDNFLTDPNKMRQTFGEETISTRDNKAYYWLRKILNILLSLPIIVGGAVSLVYMLFKLGPYLIFLIKRIFFMIF